MFSIHTDARPPERQAQTWDTAAFLDAWASEFDDDPPNAVAGANGVRVAVTLRNPWAIGGTFAEVVQDSEPIKGTVTFTATPLPGQEPPSSLINQPSLFIDNPFSPSSVLLGPEPNFQ